jgi:uncharacterized membrane protein YkvA (DUF1232 family)
MLIAAFLRDESGALWKKALLMLSVLYVVFPVDLVPDLIPIWGWLDDAGVMTFAAMFLSWAVAPYDGKRTTKKSLPSESNSLNSAR